MQRTGRIRGNPAAALVTPRKARGLPRGLDEPAIGKLLAAPDASAMPGVRDHAILELLYSTGMRVEECQRLDLADLDLGGGSVRLFGKGRKERVGHPRAAGAAGRDGLAGCARDAARPATPHAGQGALRQRA
jgi:site-specific recombinase XerD